MMQKIITVISGRLPARPITRTGRLLHTAKKKVNGLPAPVDNPHVVIQLFRWRKRDIKAIHFSLSIQTCAQFCVNISLYFIDSKHLDITRLTVLLHMYLVGEGCSKMPWPLVLQLSLERNTIRRSLSTFSLVLHFYLLTKGLETTQQDLKITKPVSTLEAKSCHFS